MAEVIIRDVPIKFPFKPYKVQEEYMLKVLECLQKGVNGVLESPTGTGKTLSLLCSSLAWLQAKKAHYQATAQGLSKNNDSQPSFSKALQSELQKSTGVTESEDSLWSEKLTTTQIVYASRTHSQIAQVMKELKRTSYSHVKTAVIGSREQLCIHPDLSEEQSFMKVTLCRAKVKARTCHYYSNLEGKKYDSTFLPGEVTDIEDLVKFGHRNQCCPYFSAREMMSSADIVFMPYNYLLNPQIRRIQQLSLHNAVVILDEAHNVERVCEESASVQISSTDIALCITEVTQVMKKFSENTNENSTEEVPTDFSMEDLCILKTMFLSLETAIDEIKLDSGASGSEALKGGKEFPATFVFELLSKAEIVREKMAVLNETLTKLAEFLSTNQESTAFKKGGMLIRFSEFLNVVFESCGETGSKEHSNRYYKVYVEPEMQKKSKQDSWSSTKTVLNSSAKVINFWCFSPGFAMRSLLRQGTHCVILTSGTLSPLHATISELGIPVNVQLENPHIIQSSQVCVSVISTGPTKEELISTFNNRENHKYLGDLGSMLVNFCRIIPSGVLVFFPSYPLMKKNIDHWQESGIWSQITEFKPVFVEPQRRESLADVMRDYTKALDVEGSRGAVFLAVLRGKVSEGLDFADTRCRAVIITGLPYPPYKDPRVMLKQDYVNKMCKVNSSSLTGRQWYELEATRAVNQAVGRVIRHASDFGAILLCDRRFQCKNVTETLSAWLRPYIVNCSGFGSAYRRVSDFFKNMGLHPPLRPVQLGASFDDVDAKVKTKEVKEKKAQKENSHASMRQFVEKVRLTQPKPLPPPSPAGLLDVLSMSPAQNKRADIFKAVFGQPDQVSESFVQPAPKKPKLKVRPVKFNLNSDESAGSSTIDAERKRPVQEYMREVKSRISTENFELFKDAVKNYAANNSTYDKTVMCLRKIFPDSTTKDLFIGFKRYIKGENLKHFEALCFRMFGSTT